MYQPIYSQHRLSGDLCVGRGGCVSYLDFVGATSLAGDFAGKRVTRRRQHLRRQKPILAAGIGVIAFAYLGI